jgi:hypothetical protein
LHSAMSAFGGKADMTLTFSISAEGVALGEKTTEQALTGHN